MKGYFRKRNNKWSFTIDVGICSQTGDRKQKTKGGFKTKGEAQIAAAQIALDVERGTYIEEKDIMFEDFARDWLRMYEKAGVKVSTIRVRKHEMGHLIKRFKFAKLQDMSKKMYQDALNSLSDHLAHSTVSGIHATGSMIFSKAIELDMLYANPTEFAKIPKQQKTVEELEQKTEIPKFLEKDELSRYLKTAQEKGLPNDYLIFKTLAYTGMRVGELCALKWSDINFKENTLGVSKTYCNPSNRTTEYQLLTPKTKASKRVTEIDIGLIEDLKKHRKSQAKVQLRNAKTYYQGDFVLGKTAGKYLGYPELIKMVRLRMARLLKIAELNGTLTPHSLRHTHTSLLAEAGVGLEEIMDRLGHKDDDITRNVYLHITKSKKKEAAQKFSELMNDL